MECLDAPVAEPFGATRTRSGVAGGARRRGDRLV